MRLCVYPLCAWGWRGFFFFFFPICPSLPLFISLSLPQRGSGIHFSWALIFSERSYILWARKPTLLHFERERGGIHFSLGARRCVLLRCCFFFFFFCFFFQGRQQVARHLKTEKNAQDHPCALVKSDRLLNISAASRSTNISPRDVRLPLAIKSCSYTMNNFQLLYLCQYCVVALAQSKNTVRFSCGAQWNARAGGQLEG